VSVRHAFKGFKVTVCVDDVMSVEHDVALTGTANPQMVATVAFEELAELNEES
jgi:hypothetical protein